MQQAKIQYSIIPSNPAAHIFTIHCRIQQPDPQGQRLWLPAWIPGSYMIRDFAKNIVSLHVQDKTGSLALQQLDKQSWRCAPSDGELSVEYQVYAYDMSVRSAHLDTTHAFFNGSSVFLAVQGQEDEPVEVVIQLPKQDFAKDWRVATTLPRKTAALFEPGIYQAANYDELIDHPVEMGEFSEINFQVNSIPHHIIVSGKHQTDLERLAADVQRICQTQVSVFEELPVMERYMFLLQVVGDGYGGLEHRSSTSLVCSRRDLPVRNMQNPSDGYITLLGLFSHEYFHTWNVKRIKPADFVPYDLRQENYTNQLWAYEGITSYYDDLGLVRSGVIDEKKYLELLGKTITRVMRGSGRLKQNLLDSSFNAWTKFYKQDENAPNAIVSYYTKGSLFALALDMTLRQISDNRKSLDDVMRQLWQEYGKTGIGTDPDSLQKLAEEICGQSLASFFERYLPSTEDLPLASLLEHVAVTLKARSANSLDDAGGTPEKSANDANSFNLGAKFIADSAGARIQFLLEDSDLQHAGLSANDVIIAINGIKTSKDNLLNLLSPCQVGEQIAIHAFRRDELMYFTVTLSSAGPNAWYLETDAQDSLSENRRQWLNTTVK